MLETGETLTGAVLDRGLQFEDSGYGALKVGKGWIAFMDFVRRPAAV